METGTGTIGSGAPPRPGRAAFSRMPSRAAAAILAAILVALALAEAVLLARAGGDERARTQVIQTSQRFLVLLTTYNAATIERQRRDLFRLAAGRFRTEYETVTGPDFVERLRQTQADSRGKVVRLAVTSLDGDDAEALAIVEVTTRNRTTPAPRVEQNVIELSLVRTGSGWRVTGVTILGTIG